MNDGSKLSVSGDSAARPRHPEVTPIYVFSYGDGKLSEKPLTEWHDDLQEREVYRSGLARHPKANRLYAANRGDDPGRGHVTVFDTESGEAVQQIPVDVSPYDLQFRADGALLYVSNWGSANVGVIDVAKGKMIATIPSSAEPGFDLYDLLVEVVFRLDKQI